MTEENDYLAPEQKARMDIDDQLVACGWVVQDYKSAAVAAAQGVAVRRGGGDKLRIPSEIRPPGGPAMDLHYTFFGVRFLPRSVRCVL